MKKLYVMLFLGIGLLNTSFAKADRAGGGGSLVIDGKRYELADLHFSITPSDQLVFDEKLKKEIQREANDLTRLARLDLRTGTLAS